MKNKIQKEFIKFLKSMQDRMNMGQKKYGDNYNKKDILQELLDEAVDLSNYTFLLYLKAKEYNKNIGRKTNGKHKTKETYTK